MSVADPVAQKDWRARNRPEVLVLVYVHPSIFRYSLWKSRSDHINNPPFVSGRFPTSRCVRTPPQPYYSTSEYEPSYRPVCLCRSTLCRHRCRVNNLVSINHRSMHPASESGGAQGICLPKAAILVMWARGVSALPGSWLTIKPVNPGEKQYCQFETLAATYTVHVG